MTNDTATRQRAMATRWWTLTAPILTDPDHHPDSINTPEPTPHDIPDSGIIQCKAAGVTVCAYDYGIGGYLSGHVYHGTTGYACFENATDDEITTLATHARHISDLTETIDERRWEAYDALGTDEDEEEADQ